jgi:Zn-dependent protease with chaperone function
MLYGTPLVWLWLVVLGMSWLELRVRGLTASLWRFHRFNLFVAFLMYGQRIPLLSAALAAPADLSPGTGLLFPVGLHLLVAILLGLLLRFLLLTVVVPVRPYPDRRLAVKVREVARTASVRLRGIFLVPTERGQSVNAIAATSSRIIFVAEGIRDGLDAREAQAVLLHELGHLAQPVKNAVLNAAGFGWPVLIWCYRALLDGGAEGYGPLELGAVALVIGAAGSMAVRVVAMAAERQADRFAARWGSPGALASALVKMFEHGSLTSRPGHRHAVVADRLGKLS